LSQEFLGNLLWKLLVGSLEIRLNRAPEGEALYREVLAGSAEGNSEIQKALHHAAEKALKRLHPNLEKKLEN
jgi:hypothetical protein